MRGICRLRIDTAVNLLLNDGMDRKDTVNITHNQAFAAGIVFVILLLAVCASYVSSSQLSSRSRAAGADLNAVPGSSFGERAKTVSAACRQLKGYLAWTGKNDVGGAVFDRFTGRYYSLDRVNPVVTPPVGQPLAGYCAVSGKPEGNWCRKIMAEPACKADCNWITSCALCAPKGVDGSLICPR